MSEAKLRLRQGAQKLRQKLDDRHGVQPETLTASALGTRLVSLGAGGIARAVLPEGSTGSIDVVNSGRLASAQYKPVNGTSIISSGGSGGGSTGTTTTVLDHGSLIGLSDDDHAQYLNTTRGDARYYTETESDARFALLTTSITGTGALAGGGTLAANRTITMGTPGTLTVSSTSSSSTNHTHAVTSSSNPGAAASLLASTAAGGLTLATLTTTGVISGAASSNTAHTLGYAKIGYVGFNGYAGFAAEGFDTSTDYALIQSATSGDLYLNTPTGRNGYIRTGNSTVASWNDNGLEAPSGKYIGSSSYVSGWAGSGWRADQNISFAGESFAEFDNLSIRGTLSVYELVINQIRATNGTLIVSSAGKIESVSGSVWTFEDPEGSNVCSFAANDIVIIQDVDVDSTTLVRRIVRRVSSVSTNTITVTAASGGPTDVGTPRKGDTVVRIGNSTNAARQGVVLITSDMANSPYQDVISGVTSWADWTGGTKTKVRLGNLTGITGTANEYGFIAGNSGFTNSNSWAKFSSAGVVQNNVNSVWRASGVTYLSIDSTNGINMEYGTGVQRRISWLSGSSELGSIGSYDLGGGSNQRALRLYSTSDASTKSASVDFTASSYSGANYASLSIDAKSDSAGGLSENRVYLAADNIVNTLGNGVFKIRYGVTDTFIFNPNTTYPYFYFKATSEKGIYLSSNYRDYATSDSGSAEIANDPATYDSLVIAGNNKSTFRRRVQIFDQLTISGNYPTVFDNQNQLQIRNGNASIGLASVAYGSGGAILWNAGLAAQTSTMFNAGQTKFMGAVYSPTTTAAGMLYYDANANYFTFQMGNVGLVEGNSINWSQKLLIDKWSNILIGGATSGSGQGVIGIKTATASPATTTGQGFLWLTAAGALMYKSPAGTITTVAPA